MTITLAKCSQIEDERTKELLIMAMDISKKFIISSQKNAVKKLKNEDGVLLKSEMITVLGSMIINYAVETILDIQDNCGALADDLEQHIFSAIHESLAEIKNGKMH